MRVPDAVVSEGALISAHNGHMGWIVATFASNVRLHYDSPS